MIYGVISLLVAQLVIAALCAVAYLRQKNAYDVDKRDREGFGAKLEVVYGKVGDVQRAVETIELSHYKALAAKYDIAMQDISRLEKQVAGLKETVEALSNKLASRDRADRAAAARERPAKPAPEDSAPSAGAAEPSVDELIRAHGIPLRPPVNGTAPAGVIPADFGRSAKPRGG